MCPTFEIMSHISQIFHTAATTCHTSKHRHIFPYTVSFINVEFIYVLFWIYILFNIWNTVNWSKHQTFRHYISMIKGHFSMLLVHTEFRVQNIFHNSLLSAMNRKSITMTSITNVTNLYWNHFLLLIFYASSHYASCCLLDYTGDLIRA